MKRELRKQFLQETYEEDSYLKFHSFRQGALSVDEYTREFEYLRLKSDIKEKPARLIARYLAGLNKPIANVIRLQPHWTFGDVVKLAKVVETQQKEAKATFSSTTIKRPNIFNHGSASLSSTKPQSSTTKPCVQKVEGKPMTSEAIFKKRCHKCGGLGHILADCPNKKAFSILEGATDEEGYNEEQHDENLEEVAEYGDDGEYLMIQRVLHSDSSKEEPWLRHNIFHTRCTSKGKFLKKWLTNWGLRQPLQKPYRMRWLDEGRNAQVNKRCLIPFSIGKNYQDKVWCDVMPMDACHLLLGRPWEYGRRAIHDGFKNTYSFVKDGKKIKLLPMNPEDLKSNPKMKETYITRAKVEEHLKEGEEVLIVVPKEVESITKKESLEVNDPRLQAILDEFYDIVSDTTPSSLPPMRSIKHQIDLIPGAPLPNKSAYRMNPTQQEALQRQVEELLDCGLIRESLSPCAVPALLVPKKDGSWR
uniref:CCHC-type domain-containing protein n=1 Tax=Nicotiana tabacum TaxID=4097 RepID=A0A1S4ANP2_TOBAC